MYGEAQYQENLIALCPVCHTKADIGYISREELRALRSLSAQGREPFPESAVVDLLSAGTEVYPQHIQSWHDVLVYRGSFWGQRRDFLRSIYRELVRTGNVQAPRLWECWHRWATCYAACLQAPSLQRGGA